MQDRASQVVAAAIRVLAAGGSRTLTHRAVDAEAHLPTGSTSNVFRTRRALVAAVVEAVLQRDLLRLRSVDAAGLPTPGAVAAAFVAATLREARQDVLARAALLVDPDGEELRRARDRFLLGGDGVPAGVTDPQVRRLVVVLVDGLLLDAVLCGASHDPGVIAASVDALVAGVARA
ncbi:MAG: hypothetical protein PGN11_19120 [Quadrisphaera sp.]